MCHLQFYAAQPCGRKEPPQKPEIGKLKNFLIWLEVAEGERHEVKE